MRLIILIIGLYQKNMNHISRPFKSPAWEGRKGAFQQKLKHLSGISGC